MSKNHQFSVLHAKQYGLIPAVLIHNLHFWIDHNHANGKHEHDGRTWTYNSVTAFEALFPYLTYKQIRTALEKLVSMNVLIRGHYSSNPADRSSWFAFTDKFLANNPLSERNSPAKSKARPSALQGTPSALQGTPSALQGTPSALQGKSLIDTDINPDINPDKGESAQAQAPAPAPVVAASFPDLDVGMALDAAQEAQASAQAQEQVKTQADAQTAAPPAKPEKKNDAVKAAKPSAISKPEDVADQVWADFLQSRKAKRSPLTATALAGIEREAAKAGIGLQQALEVCCESGWAGFKADWFANQRTVNAPAQGRGQIDPHTPVETYAQRAARQRMEEVAPMAARKAPTQRCGFAAAQAFMNGGGDVIDVTPVHQQRIGG